MSVQIKNISSTNVSRNSSLNNIANPNQLKFQMDEAIKKFEFARMRSNINKSCSNGYVKQSF